MINILNHKNLAIIKLNQARRKIDDAIAIFEKDEDSMEILDLTNAAQEDVKNGMGILIRNYVADCVSKTTGESRTYQVNEIVKSFDHL